MDCKICRNIANILNYGFKLSGKKNADIYHINYFNSLSEIQLYLLDNYKDYDYFYIYDIYNDYYKIDIDFKNDNNLILSKVNKSK